MEEIARLDQLDRYYRRIQRTILNRQNPHSGLFPASTDVNDHGDYRDAWVRDNLYTIQAIWGLYLSFKKINPDDGRMHQLEDSTVRLMRGLLSAMMKQTGKVERFKYTQNPMDALHAKYDTQTGNTVVDDDKWGHLQIDATSLYVLMLARMTKSGLRLIHNQSELTFVQNLVWYIGRGYRTPDFGIWERGNKSNNGQLEVNASSVGMVKSALQAIDKVDLLHDGQSKIFVVPDEIARCRTTLESLLPRESGSKEVDAACLSVIGYPAFAIEKKSLVVKTRERIINKLAGPWGCKRFLLDGHQTVTEQHGRLHYEQDELKNFQDIESEWPLFYTYLYLESLFDEAPDRIKYYRDILDKLRVEKDGDYLLPELYIVPKELVEAERKDPGSQNRLPNENIPLVWAQSLYYLGRMIEVGLLEKSDVDPLNAYGRIDKRPNAQVQVALLAENDDVKAELETHQILSQTKEDMAPVLIYPTGELNRIFSMVGVDREHGLTGRPMRRMRSLATHQSYLLEGRTCLFLSSFQNRTNFYLASDNELLRESIKTDLSYVSRHWTHEGLPTLVLYVRESMLDSQDKSVLLETLKEFSSGQFNGVQISTGKIHDLMDKAVPEIMASLPDYHLPIASLGERHPGSWLKFNPEKINANQKDAFSDFSNQYNDEQLSEMLCSSDDIFEQVELLTTLLKTKGALYQPGIAPGVTVQILLEEIYTRASDMHLWGLIRYASATMGKYWSALEDAVAEIITRQKQLVFGRSQSHDLVINKPESNAYILAMIKQSTGRDPREQMVVQEIIVYLYMLMRNNPDSFKGLITLRPGHLVQLIMGNLAGEKSISQDEAFEMIMNQSPSELLESITQVIESYQTQPVTGFTHEFIRYDGVVNPVQELEDLQGMLKKLPEHLDTWHQWRKQVGVMPKLNESFFEGLWSVLEKSQGLVIGDRFNKNNRLESETISSNMTHGEQQFSLLVEYVLNQIQFDDYRQLNVEAIWALIAFTKQNPELQINDFFVIEVIIAHAVRLAWLSCDHDESKYQEEEYKAWDNFYNLSQKAALECLSRAIEFLVGG